MSPLAYVALVAAFLLGGCDSCKKSQSPLLADAAPPPSFDAPKEADIRFTQDPLWQTAQEADPMDLAALADHAGASGLLEGLEQGGIVALTALRAMPYAPDAPLAYRRLCQVALQVQGDTQHEVVDVVQQLVLRHPVIHEPLDPEGEILCVSALLSVADDSAANESTRALAVSTLRLMAERVPVDAAIPTTFDDE